MDNVIVEKKGFNGLLKRAFDIEYQLIKTKLNQENCWWLSGQMLKQN